MRTALILLQLGLIATLAVSGVLASAENSPSCPLGQTPQASECRE